MEFSKIEIGDELVVVSDQITVTVVEKEDPLVLVEKEDGGRHFLYAEALECPQDAGRDVPHLDMG